ncbi:MAG TPA: hypothetical protein P5116_03175 [Eubacteriales bacterium]|nr:hypothetical protein [Eubacteriales bacterium]
MTESEKKRRSERRGVTVFLCKAPPERSGGAMYSLILQTYSTL